MKPSCNLTSVACIDNKRTACGLICKLIKTREVNEVCALK